MLTSRISFKPTALLAAVFFLSVGQASGVIRGGEEQTVDFSDPATSSGIRAARLSVQADGSLKAPENYLPQSTGTATWSSHWTQTAEGLVLAGTPHNDFVQSEPFPTGMDDRPLTACSIRISLEATGLLPNGMTPRPMPYVRYSATGKVWSSWIAVPQSCDAATIGVESYESVIAIPAPARELYQAAFEEWANPKSASSPFTGGNHDAFFHRLQAQRPEILDKEVPLIRFLQVRVEFHNGENVKLRSLQIRTSWMVSGLGQ